MVCHAMSETKQLQKMICYHCYHHICFRCLNSLTVYCPHKKPEQIYTDPYLKIHTWNKAIGLLFRCFVHRHGSSCSFTSGFKGLAQSSCCPRWIPPEYSDLAYAKRQLWECWLLQGLRRAQLTSLHSTFERFMGIAAKTAHQFTWMLQ